VTKRKTQYIFLDHTKEHLASFSEKKMVGGSDPFYLKFWIKLTVLVSAIKQAGAGAVTCKKISGAGTQFQRVPPYVDHCKSACIRCNSNENDIRHFSGTTREECSHGKQHLNRYVLRRRRQMGGDGQP